MADSFHKKYRPKRLKDVIGQDTVVRSLEAILRKRSSQVFMFSGPSGCGKTTVARIMAMEFGCTEKDLVDIDAATHTGVDAMRAVQQGMYYRPIGQSAVRAVIVDECHRLSKQAWDSLLKVVEEPPDHSYWFFCTTEPGKVPKTIKTRSSKFELQSLRTKDLIRVMKKVIKKEDGDIPSEILDVIAEEAKGSPREALVSLATCWECTDKKEALEALRSAAESEEVIELCRFLLRPGTWKQAMQHVASVEQHNPESVRIMVCNYFAAVLKNPRNAKEVPYFLSILEAFEGPYNESERQTPLILSIGRVMFSGD